MSRNQREDEKRQRMDRDVERSLAELRLIQEAGEKARAERERKRRSS